MGPQSRVNRLRSILLDDLPFDSFKLSAADRARLAALRIALKAGGGIEEARLYGILLSQNLLIGDLTLIYTLAGILQNTNITIGDLTVTNDIFLAGVLQGTNALVGDLTLIYALEGILQNTNALIGDLSVTVQLAGVLQDSNVLVGDLQLTYILAGILLGSNAMVGDLTVTTSLWTPTVDDASFCVADWDFKDSASVTLSGSNVSAIASQGTGLPTATQASGAYQPIYSTDHADFDGNDEMAISLSASPTKQTCVAVVRIESGWETSPYTSACILGSIGSGGFVFRISANGGGQSRLELVSQAVALLANDTTGLNNNSIYVVVGMFDTTTGDWAFRVNGVAGASGNRGAGGFSPGQTAVLGNGFSSSEQWYGDMFRVTVYNNVYSTGDLQIREAAAAWRATGDGSLLPIGHPYKSSAP